MGDILTVGANAALAYFLSEETRYRLAMVLSLILISLCLLRIAYALEDVAAVGYEIRNLRAYLRPTVSRTASPVTSPVSSDTPASSPAAEETVPTPPSL